MTSFTQLVASLTQNTERNWQTEIPENWMQGRTTYGGLSAALCLQAIHNQFPNLPPLRSAQISFIGPASGTVEIKVTELRRGKSVSFICADLICENSIATHTVFCFGAHRNSHLNSNLIETPKVAKYDQLPANMFAGQPMAPTFTQHFDARFAQGDLPASGAERGEFHIWSKHNCANQTDVGLLGIADMLPPAAFSMFKQLAPVSSMTWMVNIVSENITTNDGWWLLNSVVEQVENGYSSQEMKLWNSEGDIILVGKQSVAVFY